MRRLAVVFLSILFFSFARNTYAADENFFVSLSSSYKVQKDSVMSVTNTIEVVNQKTEVYAPSFTFAVQGMKPDTIKAFENGVELPVTVTENNGHSAFLVTFKKAVVGRGARRKFTLTLTDPSLIEKNGDVWEIRLPSIDGVEDFLSAKATLTVPPDFGDLASVSVTPKVVNHNVLEFDKSALSHKIVAGFGKFQMYQMLLSYEARNESDRVAVKEIPLPPDTAYQKVTITEINPEPMNVHVDEDGNWMAQYELKPHTRQSVSIRGTVKVSNDPRTLSAPRQETLEANTRPQPFWEIDKQPLITQSKNLASVEDIYHFVVQSLHYNYDRVSANVARYGALKALSSPSDALCAEFTDLFIALTRGKAIPAREINGYAVVSDSHLTPLSLVSDVLHAWPEYWDSTKSTWVAVDPTWENTSGDDYFSKMDTKHIALSIHGVKSAAPVIPLDTTDAKKAIRFSLEAPEAHEPQKPTITLDQSHSISLFRTGLTFKIKNKTGEALYEQKIEIKDSSNKSIYATTVPIIPPFGEDTHSFTLTNGLMGQSLPEKLTITVNDEITTYQVDKKISIASQLAIIFAGLLAILCIITLQARKS